MKQKSREKERVRGARVKKTMARWISRIPEEKEGAERHPSRYGTPSTTWVGRNYHAMRFIRRAFKNRSRATAWVIGLGYRDPAFENRLPFEHVEVAEALRKAGVGKIKVYAMDSNPSAIKQAANSLKKGTIKVPIPLGEIRKGTRFGAYLAEIFGKTPKKQLVDYKMPARTRAAIKLVGTPRLKAKKPYATPTGNILLETPREKPDVITCFNVLSHYSTEDARQAFAHFARALAPGGVIIMDYGSAYLVDEEDNPLLAGQKPQLTASKIWKEEQKYRVYRKAK